MSARSCILRTLIASAVVVTTVDFRLVARADGPSPVTSVVAFAPPDFPESITIAKTGDMYVSMYATGEIRKIATDGTQSTLAVLGSGPASPFPGRRLAGLTVDARGDVYAALNDVPSTRGVWRIARDGNATLFAALPSTAGPNGLAFDAR